MNRDDIEVPQLNLPSHHSSKKDIAQMLSLVAGLRQKNAVLQVQGRVIPA